MALVGNLGKGLEIMAVIGVAPNVASRIQNLAAPDSVLISADTYQLIEGRFGERRFVVRDLGLKELKGIAKQVAVYEVQYQITWDTRDIAALQGLPPMVGRHAESRFLRERWDAASRGDSGGVLVVGEAGIGKSRLLWDLRGARCEVHGQFARAPVVFRVSSEFRLLSDRRLLRARCPGVGCGC